MKFRIIATILFLIVLAAVAVIKNSNENPTEAQPDSGPAASSNTTTLDSQFNLNIK